MLTWRASFALRVSQSHNESTQTRKVNAASSRSQLSVGISRRFGCLLRPARGRTPRDQIAIACGLEALSPPHTASRDRLMSIAEKRRTFRALHQTGCWVIPNPWNIGTARYLQGLGFKALATTSAGYAHSYGYSDGDVTKDMVLAHCRDIAQAADIPVNADFENGYADDPDEMAANV